MEETGATELGVDPTQGTQSPPLVFEQRQMPLSFVEGTRPFSDTNKAIASLIKREGGYVQDPADPGGATKFGITQNTLASYRGQAVTPADVQELSSKEAAQIYKDMYWSAPGTSRYPKPLQEYVFDMNVNHGPENSRRILADALRSLGYTGSPTDAARKALKEQGEDKVLSAVRDQRKQFYREIVKKNPEQRKFMEGWLRRAESV